MTSKSELKRKCTLAPIAMAERMYELEQQVSTLTRERDEARAQVAMLRACLANALPPNIERACDECGGNGAHCPDGCYVRTGRQAIVNTTASAQAYKREVRNDALEEVAIDLNSILARDMAARVRAMKEE
jgi:hypothetical protein